jgi:quercetin dioxygenase-like cupin family protein
MRSHLIYGVAVSAAIGLLASPLNSLMAHGGPEQVTLAFATKLPNVPGKNLTAVVVTYAPGMKSPSHHHAGSVYAYVLSGEIRSANSATGPVRVYKAGESFFEPPGSAHTVSENASATASASLLAVFVADEGATLTTPDK